MDFREKYYCYLFSDEKDDVNTFPFTIRERLLLYD